MDVGHRDRSLQPWCPTATPEARGYRGVEQLWLFVNWDMPTHREVPRWNSPFPLSLALEQPRHPPSSPAQPPVPPLGAQFWDVRRVLCRGLFQTPQLQGTTSAGPGAPSLPRSHNALGALRDHHGPSRDPPAPPFTPRRLLGRSDTNAKATGHGPPLPPPPGRSEGSSGLAVPLDLHFSLSVSWCKRPRRTNPGQVLGWDQHFRTRVPPEWSDGIGMDGNELQAWEISPAMRWQYCM